jgi:predicted anti-sigma-YlaC factor YlaD
MDHQDCRHLLASLSEFVDGTLEAELCAEIQRHMEGCENCRIVIDSLQKTIYMYQVTKDPAVVPEDVRQRLYKRLDLDSFLENKAV